MKECRQWLVSWLNDAYAMEEGMVDTLEKHVDQADGHPEIQTRIRAHIDHSKSQSARIRQSIDMLGGKVSSTKKLGTQMFGWLGSMVVGRAEDRIVKNLLAEYSSEHFEMASYRAIAQAAIDCGHQEVAVLCREIVREEEQMAETLSRNLEGVVSEFLRPYRTSKRAA